MKIAYLITAYNNFNHLERLISAITDKDALIFIHLDKKSEVPAYFKANDQVILIDRIEVWWGGWSHMQAIINLMKEAIKYNFDYYVLLSGADYPVKAKSFLYNILANGGEYINLIEGFHSHKPEERIKFYHFDGYDRRNLKSWKTKLYVRLEKLLRIFITKKNYPFHTIYHGTTWWALSHGLVEYILNEIDSNPKLVKFYKSSWCAEESMLQTIIGNSPYKDQCKHALTYSDWSVEPGPAMFNLSHLEILKSNTSFTTVYGDFEPYFARKFNDQSAPLIDLIDSQLRQEGNQMQ